MSYDKQKKNGVEERVFSVTMTEEELSLFSEFLEQREYARGVVSKMNPNLTQNGRMIKGNTPSSKTINRRYNTRAGIEGVKSSTANKPLVDQSIREDRMSQKSLGRSVNVARNTGRLPEFEGSSKSVHDRINSKQAILDRTNGSNGIAKSGKVGPFRNISETQTPGRGSSWYTGKTPDLPNW